MTPSLRRSPGRACIRSHSEEVLVGMAVAAVAAGTGDEKEVAAGVGIAVGSRHSSIDRWPAGWGCSSYRIRP